jgi:VIT1/CCC1 family predicted Fe2+/Mn2+ transporter
MGRIGSTEIILLIATPLMFFMFGFLIGRISGKNSVYKKLKDKN